MVTELRRAPTGAAHIALLLALLAGCGEEDRTHTQFTQSTQRTATSGDDANPRLAPIAPGPAAPMPPIPPAATMTVALAPVGESTVSGEARLSQVGTGTSVFVTLRGTEAGRTYEGAVRLGLCPGTGSIVESLVPVTSDSLSSGRSASDLPFPLDSLRRAPHVLVFGRGNRPESCGAVSGFAGASADTLASRPREPVP